MTLCSSFANVLESERSIPYTTLKFLPLATSHWVAAAVRCGVLRLAILLFVFVIFVRVADLRALIVVLRLALLAVRCLFFLRLTSGRV